MRYRKGIASFHKKCKEKPYKIRWLDTPSQDARFCNDFRENVTLCAFPVTKVRLAIIDCENIYKIFPSLRTFRPVFFAASSVYIHKGQEHPGSPVADRSAPLPDRHDIHSGGQPAHRSADAKSPARRTDEARTHDGITGNGAPPPFLHRADGIRRAGTASPLPSSPINAKGRSLWGPGLADALERTSR